MQSVSYECLALVGLAVGGLRDVDVAHYAFSVGGNLEAVEPLGRASLLDFRLGGYALAICNCDSYVQGRTSFCYIQFCGNRRVCYPVLSFGSLLLN